MRNHPDAEVLLSVLGLDGPGRPARGGFGDGSGVQFVGADRRDEPRLGDQPTRVASGRRFGDGEQPANPEQCAQPFEITNCDLKTPPHRQYNNRCDSDA